MTNWVGMSSTAASGVIPDNVKWSFYIGAFFFLTAVLYTVFTSKEYPPVELPGKEKAIESEKGIGHGVKEILSDWLDTSNVRALDLKAMNRLFDTVSTLSFCHIQELFLCLRKLKG